MRAQLTLAIAGAMAAASVAAAPPAGTVEAAAAEAYDAATDLRRAERYEEAARAYEQLAATYPNSRLAPRALASAAALWQWDLGAPARASALYDRVIAGPDDRPGVLPAIIQRLQLEEEGPGPAAALALADRWLTARPRGEQAPFLLMYTAELLAARLGDRAGAVARLERLLAASPGSTRADEAQLQAAGLYRQLGRPADAIAKYRALMSTRSSSWIVGEYDSTKLDDAYFELAETQRLDLRDARAAEASYRKLVEDLPASRFVDDALHHASELARARGDTAQAGRDRAALARLRPGSRWLKKGEDPR